MKNKNANIKELFGEDEEDNDDSADSDIDDDEDEDDYEEEEEEEEEDVIGESEEEEEEKEKEDSHIEDDVSSIRKNVFKLPVISSMNATSVIVADGSGGSGRSGSEVVVSGGTIIDKKASLTRPVVSSHSLTHKTAHTQSSIQASSRIQQSFKEKIAGEKPKPLTLKPVAPSSTMTAAQRLKANLAIARQRARG